MKRPLIAFSTLFLLTAVDLHAQSKSTGRDTLSAFPGGDAAFEQFIVENLQISKQTRGASIQAMWK